MVLFDSCVWVAFYLDFDSTHEKAIEIFSTTKWQILVPYCVVAEVSTVLTYKHSKEQANQFIGGLLKNRDITLVEAALYEEVAFFAHNPWKLSFYDYSIIKCAIDNKAKLVSFDEEMIKVYEKMDK